MAPHIGKQGSNLKNRIDSRLAWKRVCDAFIRKHKQLVNVYVNMNIFIKSGRIKPRLLKNLNCMGEGVNECITFKFKGFSNIRLFYNVCMIIS